MLKKIDLFVKRYGWRGSLRHIYYYVFTKLFFSGARLVRLPIEIRGRYLIDFGKNLTTGSNCRIEAVTDIENQYTHHKQIKLGNNVTLNDNVHIASRYSIEIGNNVLIASKVFITDHQHGDYNLKPSSPEMPPNDRDLSGSPVKIEDNVWIGEFVSILPGVTIGKGCIIGTQSVVNKSIPPYSIVVGAPAKIIKTYNFQTQTWERV
jgi:acetyltransferase-like isoleucine patch superfamily enzyme